MRNSGELTGKDKRALARLHKESIELASACYARLNMGNDDDKHPNSWWRLFDEKIKNGAAIISSYAKKFDDEGK